MQLTKILREHVRAVLVGAMVALVLVASVASAATFQSVKGSAVSAASESDDEGGEDKGEKGEKGDKEEYGIAVVRVQRGATAAVTPWAVYSTELGSPMGDSTGGTFRFTCRAGNSVCKVSIAAKVLSDSSTAPALVYPRILIHRGGSQTSSVEPMFYCEYGDGPQSTITRKPKSDTAPSGDPINVHIGGSADCNGPDATAGSVAVITVPEGYYDVWTSFQFQKDAPST